MKVRKSALIFYYTNNKILLQDRRSIAKRGEDWGFFGGKIEERESPLEAVKREIKEELSIDEDNLKLIAHIHEFVKAHEKIMDTYIFISPLDNKLKDMIIKEGDAAKLFTKEEALKLKMIDGDEKIINLVFDAISKIRH